jgi:hypothetical protein
MFQFQFDLLVEQLLEESQTFNFADSKSIIINYIEKKINKEYASRIEDEFYYILRNKSAIKVGAAKKIGFTDKEISAWKEYFTDTRYFGGDGVWSQVEYGKQFKRKTGQDRTLNYYGTILKSKDNILKFKNAFFNLAKRLSEFSLTNQAPIGAKTHAILDGMLGDNDSFKIYFYDPAFKRGIEQLAEEWASANNVKMSKRTHTFGVDVRSSGSEDKESFGQLLAKHLGRTLDDLIEKNGNKYTPDQYYQWIAQNAEKIIKQATPKEYI